MEKTSDRLENDPETSQHVAFAGQESEERTGKFDGSITHA